MNLGAVIMYLVLAAQATNTAAAQQKSAQNIPDAPSATRPPQPQFPPGTTARQPDASSQPAPSASPNPNATVPGDTPRPSSEIKTPAPGGQGILSESEQEQLTTFRRNVNFVVVPVTVKDSQGRPVAGLVQRDFAIYEDGELEQINFFTSDALPLSAAVIIDLSMPDVTLRKVNAGLFALQGAFSEYDEVSLFTYGSSVHKALDFNAVGDKLSEAIVQITKQPGRTGGVPVTSGPLASGPTVNGRPFDPGQQRNTNVPVNTREAHVLNDAILMAANELARRPASRRRVIFIISDGKEDESNASYSDVLKVLLSNEVIVYAIAVDSAAIPFLSTIDRLHIARFGYSNILRRYTGATGGDIFSEFSRDAIEQAYKEAAAEARNQYTLGYTTRATLASNHRSIEVRVHRPNLIVTAKEGYYPLPPKRKATAPQ